MEGRITIVCAVAGDTPPQVVEASSWLARELGGDVVLAHAFDALAIAVPPAAELTIAGVTSDEVASAERDRARARLEALAARFANVEHTTVVAGARPVPALLGIADEHDASLMLTGTAARGGLDRVLVGSVASDLASQARCPVVVVREDAALGAAGPVVVGYDGSDDSLRAARHAAALASGLGRGLVLVHVVDADTEPVQADVQLARELHEAVAACQIGRPQRVDAAIAVERGDPVEQLTDLARRRQAALLVTGTRGRGAVTSALLGSVSSGVVRTAGRPVVLVGPAAEGLPRASAVRR